MYVTSVDATVNLILHIAPTAEREWTVNRMDDLISRQAVIEMLDETRRIAERNIDGAVLMTFEKVLDSLVNITNALPTIQPEIVRCKDCKHRDPEDKKCDCGHDILWQLPRRNDWFCADGERRENNESN